MKRTVFLGSILVLLPACPDSPVPSDTEGTSSDPTSSTGTPPTGSGPPPGSSSDSTGPDPTTSVDSSSTDSVDSTSSTSDDSDSSDSSESTGTTGTTGTTGMTECEPGTYGPDCSGVCDCNTGTCNDGMEGDGSCTCLPDTYGPDCAGLCDCNTGTCSDGAAGDGSCTCLPDTYGPDCAGMCACTITECDDGAMGSGSCQCPDVSGTFAVAYLPGWGQELNDGNLGYSEIQSNWMAYGPCEPTFTVLSQPFTLADLTATGAHVVLAANPSGGNVQYSAAELTAVHDYVSTGNAGFVSTYLLSFTTSDNTQLSDLAGIDPAAHLTDTFIPAGTTVDVLIPGHPLAQGVPLNFNLNTFTNSQDMGQPWAATLLPGAEIVMESPDMLNVVIAYEGVGWRGTRVSTFPEYQSLVEGRQVLYNALLWSAFAP